MADSARGGDCPAFGPLGFPVAEDKQCDAFVLPGMPHFVWGEDYLGPVCGCSFDLDMPYLVTTSAEEIVAFLAMDILDVPGFAIEVGGHVHRMSFHRYLHMLVELESLPSSLPR